MRAVPIPGRSARAGHQSRSARSNGPTRWLEARWKAPCARPQVGLSKAAARAALAARRRIENRSRKAWSHWDRAVRAGWTERCETDRPAIGAMPSCARAWRPLLFSQEISYSRPAPLRGHPWEFLSVLRLRVLRRVQLHRKKGVVTDDTRDVDDALGAEPSLGALKCRI